VSTATLRQAKQSPAGTIADASVAEATLVDAAMVDGDQDAYAQGGHRRIADRFLDSSRRAPRIHVLR
jgi:hypothetical protein